ncbi:MAG: OmpA family protein [Saprospiraceae bacterium]|nr:OmpA family protein [Saprospiraceae bacterium]
MKSNGEWAPGKNLGPEVNSPANEGFPFIDKNGNLYFCSKGHVGFGGFDIFVSKANTDGSWSQPVNLGKPINSAMDDISICLNKNGDSGLFTSSRSGGDDDIYLFYPDSTTDEMIVMEAKEETQTEQVEKNNETQTKEEFISLNLNKESQPQTQPNKDPNPPTPTFQKEEDPNLTPTEKPIESLASMEAQESNKFQEETKLEEVEEAPSFQEETLESSESIIEKEEIQATETSTTEPIASTNHQSEALPTTEAEIKEQQELRIPQMEVTSPLAQNANFDEPSADQNTVMNESDLVRAAWNKNLEPGYTFVISAIKFNVGTADLNDVIKLELDKLVDFLKQYPEVKVEIGCHTINLYDKDENSLKSEERATNILQYLVEKGIASGRLQAKGYGSSTPINDCKSLEDCPIKDHLVNQRLEIKVLEVAY